MSATTRLPRRSDLDWLRICAVALLVPFHAALVFNLDPNSIVYLKDSVQSDFLVQVAGFIARWQMEVLFLIAGAASWFALGRRTAGQYLSERVLRLLLPFVFGVLTLLPLMTYVHWLGRSDAPSFAQHYAGFFQINAADLAGLGGTWTPGHLWFIMFLFVFSLIGLPLFLLLRHPQCQAILATLAAWPGTIYAPFVVLFLARLTSFLGDKNPLYYFLVFAIGYSIMSQPRFQSAIDRYLPLSLALALGATLITLVVPVGWAQADPMLQLAGLLLYRLSQWTWVLTILGAGHRWLNREGPTLRYLSEAAYPFYILHLPIMTLVTYFAIQLDTPVAAKYVLIIAATAVASLAIYDLLVKRVGVLRFLFGLKPARNQERVPTAPRAAAAG